ncbi:MAG: hypothetical protein CMI60_23765 [Parvibaculum sp.]|nr:hypothetical protein [Parvibaculum sp.]|tara:strand:- start:514 stop:717 length:204 start_codon:yes stop_codon:yes gene_type:complete
MDNQIFAHYRELKIKEQEAIQLLLKLGYVIGDREAINETVMLIKGRKVDFIEGVDSIVKELNQNKDD